MIQWLTPYDGASDITSYTIKLLGDDGITYYEEKTYCDGSQAEIMSTRQCTVPSVIFTQLPYNLKWGSSIYAQIVATNIKGTSSVSESGNGAIILRVPDAPINLSNVVTLTDFDTIGLTWQEGPENGGSVVIDYRVKFSTDAVTFTNFETGITVLPYQANSLIVGTTYTFKVEARNEFGYSAESSPISILTAE